MISILHGEHHVASRNELVRRIDQAKAQGKTVVHMEVKAANLREVEMALESTELFAQNTLVVLEKLHSLPKSKTKDALLAKVAGTAHDVLLWESAKLTATQLKQWPSAEVRVFQLKPILFEWLESLSPGNTGTMLRLFQLAAKQESAELCLFMMQRQLRSLLQIKAGVPLKTAPFLLQKLSSQARKWSQEQLLTTHAKLFALDRKMKTSGGVLSLQQELDLLLATL